MKTQSTILTKGGVLLMGEDCRLQQSMRAALEAENYEVFLAASREEAEEILEAASIDILVTDADYELERLGPMLARFKAERPHLRTIGLRRAQHGPARGNPAGVNAWIEKTLGPGRLVATVNALFAGLQSEIFREEMLHRQTAPLFTSVPYSHWGLNE